MHYLRNDSSYRLCRSLNEKFQTLAVQMENKYLRKLVSELTTGNFDSIDFLLLKKAKEIKLQSCISWFLSDNPLKIYLRETLRENMKQYGDTLKQQVDILLLSK